MSEAAHFSYVPAIGRDDHNEGARGVESDAALDGGIDVEIVEGASMLTSLLAAGQQPMDSFLCGTGDCSGCAVQVDGVAYVRACQTAPRPGQSVVAHPAGAAPPLDHLVPGEAGVDLPRLPPRRVVHADVVVIGAGSSGQAAAAAAEADGSSVVVLDAAAGDEAIGVYDGPLVVSRREVARGVSGEVEIVHVHAGEVVAATGAADLAPVCTGNATRGVSSLTVVEQLTNAAVTVGRVVVVLDPDGPGVDPADVRARCDALAERGVEIEIANGQLRGIDSVDGRVRAALVTSDGDTSEHACDWLAVALGRAPRDLLVRMGADDVRAVGSAALDPGPPRCPSDGRLCPCNDLDVEVLDDAWDRGFRTTELVKRATLAGTGTCQGAQCTPYVRAFLAERGVPENPAFTARPVARGLTLSEVSAGQHHPTVPRTSLDAVHRRLGATMDRIGGWWRPWNYGDTAAEIDAVRNRVSLGDVGTLGKMVVSGPSALAALQRLYPTDVSTIRPGRSRYVLLLNEAGYVLDDGMICREPEGDRFFLTFTSGGASVAEMWVRDWTADLDVRWMNLTMSLGAINVTGPRAAELLRRVGFEPELRFLEHTTATVADVECRVLRVSFTGEASYELHHPFDRSEELWDRLTEAGADLGVMPHGLEALTALRLQKGHIIVGQDTDFDSTPRRIAHEWAVNLDKGDFIGRHAVLRTGQLTPDKQLVGFTCEGPPPPEGAVAWLDEASTRYAGYLTSAGPGHDGGGVMLGWLYLHDGELPDRVHCEGRVLTRSATPFYDTDGRRARG